jgi:hypothetical protein
VKVGSVATGAARHCAPAAPIRRGRAARQTSPLDHVYPHHHFIQCYSHLGRAAVLVEFGLETWLITEQQAFFELSRDLAMQGAAYVATAV